MQGTSGQLFSRMERLSLRLSLRRTQLLLSRVTVHMKWNFTFPANAASSTGRCNTIQCIDSTMLARENHLFGCTRSKPSQGSVPAGLTLMSDFSFCFQCQADSSLVLRRPIEITAFIRHQLITRL
jgi:hypothetical protein